MKKVIFICVGLLLLMFHACTKDIQKNKPVVNNGTSTRKDNTISPGYSNNPYDMWGANHNNALRDYMNDLNTKWINELGYESLYASGEYYADLYNITSSPEIFVGSLDELVDIITVAIRADSLVQGIISDEARCLLAEVLDSLSGLKELDYVNQKMFIVRAEDILLNNRDKVYLEKDVEILLKYFSILRYSLYFWNPESEETGYFTATFSPTWGDLLIIAAGDAAGLLLGNTLTGSLIAVAVVAAVHMDTGDTIVNNDNNNQTVGGDNGSPNNGND